MSESNPVDRAINILNRALKTDPVAVLQLLRKRYPCNEELADDPAIVVRVHQDGSCSISALGLINGILGDDVGPIAAVVDEDTGNITGFERYV